MRTKRSDEQLARALADGDETALAELYDAYAGDVFSLAYRLLGNRHEAEDLVQETFVGLLRNPGGYRGESKFTTWVYRVVLNRTKNLFRQKTRERDRLKNFREIREAEVDEADGASAQDERSRQLHQAVQALPDPQREVLILAKFQNRSYAEIGKIVGASAEAVKMRVSRAINELRKRMGT